MVRVRKAGPSYAYPITPKRVANAQMSSGIFRTTRIQTLPHSKFKIRGAKPSGPYSMNFNYAKVITNEAKADAFDKKARYLSKAKRKSAGTLSRVIIRTHNKEYSTRIAAQDGLRRANDRQAKKIKWDILRVIEKISHARVKQKPLTDTYVHDLVSPIPAKVEQWAEHAKAYFPGEEFFLQKGPNNIARKLALKRMDFIVHSGENLRTMLEMLMTFGGLHELDFAHMSTVIDEALAVGSAYKRKYVKNTLPRWLR